MTLRRNLGLWRVRVVHLVSRFTTSFCCSLLVYTTT